VASSKEIGDSDWGRGGSVARLPSSVIRLIDIVKDVTVASALPALAPLVGGALFHEVFMAERRGWWRRWAGGGICRLSSAVCHLIGEPMRRCLC